MEKKYKLIIICSVLVMIIINIILIYTGIDVSQKGQDVVKKVPNKNCDYKKEKEEEEEEEDINDKCINEKNKAVKDELNEVYPTGEYPDLRVVIMFVFLLISHFVNIIFFIVLFILFATSSARICRSVLLTFILIVLSISLLISILFVAFHTQTEVDLNDDELYIFDDELNKQLKEVLDDLTVRLLYYVFSLISVCLAYIGCIVLLIFNVKDKDERN